MINVGCAGSDDEKPSFFKLKKSSKKSFKRLRRKRKPQNSENPSKSNHIEIETKRSEKIPKTGKDIQSKEDLNEKYQPINSVKLAVSEKEVFDATNEKVIEEGKILNAEDMEGEEFLSIPNIDHIALAKNKRNLHRNREDGMFRKMDIDECTSMKNKKLYDFAMDEDDLSNEERPLIEKELPKGKVESNAKDAIEIETIYVQEKKEVRNLKQVLKECIKDKKGVIKEIENIKDERKELVKEIEQSEKNVEKLNSLDYNLAKKYEFFQEFSEVISALSYCLTEKIPLIELCADKLLELRKKKLEYLNKYYLEGNDSNATSFPEEIKTQFNQKIKVLENKSKNAMKDVRDDLMDIPILLERFESVRTKFPNLYLQNFLPESIPSLIVPILGYFLLHFHPETNKRQFERSFEAILQSDENHKNNEQGESEEIKISICEKVFEIVLEPLFAEKIEYEWDLFDVEETKKILLFIETFRKMLKKANISFKSIFIEFFKRFYVCFTELNKTEFRLFFTVESLRRNKDKILSDGLKNYKSVIEFLCRDEFEKDLAFVKVLQIYENSNGIENKSVGESKETIEDKIMDLSFTAKNVLKAFDYKFN